MNRPPNIYLQPTEQNVYYKPGESVELLCVANGIPKPVYVVVSLTNSENNNQNKSKL